MLLLALAYAPGPASAGASRCEATGGGDKLCKTYGLKTCSGGACRKWVNRCEIKKSGAFYCNYEAAETRCGGGSGCHTVTTVCHSTRRSQSCVTTDPDVCRPSGSGFRTCSSSTNTCKTYGRSYRCTFDQHYTSCKAGACKQVDKACHSGSNMSTWCKSSVKQFRTTAKPSVPADGGDDGDVGAASYTGACPDPTTYTGDTSEAPEGFYADCPGFDSTGAFVGDSAGVALATGACPDPATYTGTADQVPPGYYDGCPGIKR